MSHESSRQNRIVSWLDQLEETEEFPFSSVVPDLADSLSLPPKQSEKICQSEIEPNNQAADDSPAISHTFSDANSQKPQTDESERGKLFVVAEARGSQEQLAIGVLAGIIFTLGVIQWIRLSGWFGQTVQITQESGWLHSSQTNLGVHSIGSSLLSSQEPALQTSHSASDHSSIIELASDPQNDSTCQNIQPSAYSPRWIEDSFRIDLNETNWVEWMQLPGIGETLAKRIVNDMKANGPFRSVNNLQRVKGIGTKTLKKIRPFIQNASSTSK